MRSARSERRLARSLEPEHYCATPVRLHRGSAVFGTRLGYDSPAHKGSHSERSWEKSTVTEPRQLVLDVVVGIDDALMMLMHLSEPSVENIAVGSNHGRCHLHRHPCRHIA